MTPQTYILCPECSLPGNLVAGKFPLHTLMGQKCPMSGHEPDPVPAILAKARRDDTKPARPPRRVRSDKGSKRRPRTEGGESHDDTPNGRSTLQAAPGGPAEPGQPNELATSNRLPTHPEPAEGPSPAPSAPVEPRAGYLVTVREGVKAAFYLALEEAERGAQINLIPGETRIIYYIKPVGIVTLEMKIRHVGRVRKARP